MTCDLEGYFGELGRSLPQDPAEDVSFVLTAENVPACPALIRSDQVVARGAGHDYGGLVVDVVDLVFAGRATCRQLGLLVLSSLFHPAPETIELELTNPTSEIRRLRVRFARPNPETALDYWATPTGLRYVPGQAERHPTPPWVTEHLPEIQLTDQEEVESRLGFNATRDTVVGFGDDRATAWIAELLIDAGCEKSEVVEVDLESFAGFGGVGRQSAELRLWLPGSDFWDARDFASQ